MDVEGSDGWQSGVSAAAAMEEAAGPSFLGETSQVVWCTKFQN